MSRLPLMNFTMGKPSSYLSWATPFCQIWSTLCGPNYWSFIFPSFIWNLSYNNTKLPTWNWGVFKYLSCQAFLHFFSTLSSHNALAYCSLNFVNSISLCSLESNSSICNWTAILELSAWNSNGVTTSKSYTSWNGIYLWGLFTIVLFVHRTKCNLSA